MISILKLLCFLNIWEIGIFIAILFTFIPITAAIISSLSLSSYKHRWRCCHRHRNCCAPWSVHHCIGIFFWHTQLWKGCLCWKHESASRWQNQNHVSWGKYKVSLESIYCVLYLFLCSKFWHFGWSRSWDSYSLSNNESYVKAVDFLERKKTTETEKPFFLFWHTNVMHDFRLWPLYWNNSDYVGVYLEEKGRVGHVFTRLFRLSACSGVGCNRLGIYHCNIYSGSRRGTSNYKLLS